jgi:hypothetical protein
MKKHSECSTKHRKDKQWVGKFGLFWVNGQNSLYCHCAKCGRYFTITDVTEKDFTWGDMYYKNVRVDYDSAL